MIRAFATTIEANGGGTILNILSVLSWVSVPTVGAYCAAKAASWSMTDALRAQLAANNIRVSGLHVGHLDTDMAASVTAPKSDPADIARIAMDSIEADVAIALRDHRRRRQSPHPNRLVRRRRSPLPTAAVSQIMTELAFSTTLSAEQLGVS